MMLNPNKFETITVIISSIIIVIVIAFISSNISTICGRGGSVW